MSRFRVLLGALLWCSSMAASPIADLEPVGSATLRVLLWTIYESRLYTIDGEYDGIEPGLALEIEYRRAIPAGELIDRTREEWRKQSLYTPTAERWLKELAGIWPDVVRGDKLLLRIERPLSSRFYLNGEIIGSITDPDFSRAFLAIWLSENSSYPGLRDQLVSSND